MSTIGDMIDAAAVCAKCKRTRRDGCDCWVTCECGWLKERGAPGCQRCAAVPVQRIGSSLYEARPGAALVSVRKDGIHWRFTLKCGCGCGLSREDDRQFGTKKDAASVGIGLAFALIDEGPPFTIAEEPA